MILLIDNYDSFVYNLARYFRESGCETRVVRNDALGVADVRRLGPAAVVLSPGPCTPDEAGISLELVRALCGEIPLLGVCLGHQAIAQALGGTIVRAPEPVHGRTSWMHHTGEGLFTGLPIPFQATRYHSLMIDEATLPDELEITARTTDGLPMALAHRNELMFGVQFHPESILTPAGHSLLARFLQLAGIAHQPHPHAEVVPPASAAGWISPQGQPLHW